MARGDHLKKYYFKEGNPGGPGRPPLTPEEREVRSFTRKHVAEVYNKIIDMTKTELDELLADPEVPLFEKAVARGVINAEASGSVGGTLESILERIIGRVPQRIEGDPENPIGFLVLKTPASRKKEGNVDEVHI